MRRQIAVGFREMVVAEKSAICRQGRRVGRGEHQMLLFVDSRPFFDGKRPPEHKHQMLALLAQALYHRIGKFFPALALVRCSLVLFHREGGIE